MTFIIVTTRLGCDSEQILKNKTVFTMDQKDVFDHKIHNFRDQYHYINHVLHSF